MKRIILVLLFILCSNTAIALEYKRSYFGNWIDADKDKQDTRQEILIRESFIPVTFDVKGRVVKGLWFCIFSQQYFEDPKAIEIDHLVPLKEAWLSGADKWSKQKRIAYFNYLDDRSHLIVMYSIFNKQKGYSDITQWYPEKYFLRDIYFRMWVHVKEEWGLCYDLMEAKVLDDAGLPVTNICGMEVR